MERTICAACFLLVLLLSCHAAVATNGRWPPPTLATHYSSSLSSAARQVMAAGGSEHAPPSVVQYETRWYTQRLDHFNVAPASYGTFQQRYLVNDTFWGGKNAPIFLYAGNEGDVELFANNTGFMWEVAPRFGAMLVFVEHRYYGASMPFGSAKAAFKDASTKGYLTTTQAIADLATLVLSLKANLSAPAAPVLAFGGSYGGMLAAWMRLKYPHIVMGAVASSAPILSFYGLADPYAFYDAVTKDFKSESENCYDVLRRSWDELDKALATDAGRAELNRKFKMCDGKVETIPDLLDTAVIYGAMMDYPTSSGFLTPLPAYPVRLMCRAMDDNPTSSSGAGDVLSRVREALNVYYNHTGAAACFGAAEDDDPYGMFSGWNWQARTEMVLMTAAVRDGGVLPFNLTELLDEGRNYTGLPPRPFWIETEFGGFVSVVFDLVTKLGRMWFLPHACAHHVDLRFSNKDDPDWLKQVRRKETRIIARWLSQYYSDEGISA
ncbi:hypothetical protein PR202_gb16375 [Eleusine coracana subsp. coracana]|uniref:Lysosomal Pro-X carboxypeptidase n=1 Tax=Eleusine coracana subsp. coracana TaxID=191504 RepID=A0AAV5F1B7_ELECO|nr:hypothetical protein QOZ80_9BG0698980 [Eleusine coracana subsp. coracana]GJN28270.1 hypothetical protein PR202_gb16375 [Eleusine coracana subsp. coracana]